MERVRVWWSRGLGRWQGRTRRELAERLLASAESLAGCAAATDPDFVALGGDLRALFESATEMAQSVDGTTTRLHTGLTAQRIGGADGLVAAVMRAFQVGVQEADHELEQLKTITQGLTAMEPQLARIERAGVLLQCMSVGFAVESSRTAECQQAFGSFVDEIRGLSRRIAAVENTISEELRRARDEESKGLGELAAELGAMRELARQLEQTSAEAAGKVQDGLNRTVGLMEAARARSAQVSRHTEEAVYQVQFGDIIRQKIEHIVTVLRETATGVKDRGRDFRQAATDADRALAIQVAQLEAVGEELETAQQQLEQSFTRIAGATAEFVAPLQEQGGGESARLQALKADFERLLELDDKGRRLRARAATTAGHAFATAERLATQMQEVQSINREMHLLALNAIVKTAALGSSGATLEVLSMQVHGLYVESDAVVAGIGEQAGRLQRRDPSGAAASGPAADESGAKGRLEEGVRQVRLAYEGFDRAVADSAERVGAQTASLTEASARLGALRAFAQQLRRQTNELAALRTLLAPWCRSSGAAETLDGADIDARYTMQSQREVHRRAVGGAVPATAAAKRQSPMPEPAVVETAGAVANHSVPKEPGATTDGGGGAARNVDEHMEGNTPTPTFGDNVELF